MHQDLQNPQTISFANDSRYTVAKYIANIVNILLITYYVYTCTFV